METFPNLWMRDFLRWATVRNIKRMRPLYHMDYRKDEAKRLLSEQLGWTWYGGHHLENRFTAFFHTYFLPRRYGIDARQLGHAALVRSGQWSREEALADLETPIVADPQVIALVRRRLGFSEEELEAAMSRPHLHYSDYPTYKPWFERMRPLFWALYKLDRVPRSFYAKFTHPDPSRPVTRRTPLPTPVVHGAPSLSRPD
jgi:hypothetical protein